MGDRKGTGEKKIHKETYSQLQLLQGTGSKRTSGSAFLFVFVCFVFEMLKSFIDKKYFTL